MNCTNCGKPIVSNQLFESDVQAFGLTCTTTPPPYARAGPVASSCCCSCPCPPSCCDEIDVNFYCFDPCCPCPIATCGPSKQNFMFGNGVYDPLYENCSLAVLNPALAVSLHAFNDNFIVEGSSTSTTATSSCFTCSPSTQTDVQLATSFFTCNPALGTTKCCYTASGTKSVGLNKLSGACVYVIGISYTGGIFNGYAGEDFFSGDDIHQWSDSFQINPGPQTVTPYTVGKTTRCVGPPINITKTISHPCTITNPADLSDLDEFTHCFEENLCNLQAVSGNYQFQMCGGGISSFQVSASAQCCLQDGTAGPYGYGDCCPNKCWASCMCCVHGVDLDNLPNPCTYSTSHCWLHCDCCGTPCSANYWATPDSWEFSFNGSPTGTGCACIDTNGITHSMTCGAPQNLQVAIVTGTNAQAAPLACVWSSNNNNIICPFDSGCLNYSKFIVNEVTSGTVTSCAFGLFLGFGCFGLFRTTLPKPVDCTSPISLTFASSIFQCPTVTNCDYSAVTSVIANSRGTGINCKPTCCDNAYMFLEINAALVSCDKCCAWENAHAQDLGGNAAPECGCPTSPGTFTNLGLLANFEQQIGNFNLKFEFHKTEPEKVPRQFKLKLGDVISTDECNVCEKYNTEWILDYYKEYWFKIIDICDINETIKLSEFNNYFYLIIGNEDSGALYSTPYDNWNFLQNNLMTLDAASSYCSGFPLQVELKPVNTIDLIPYKLKRKKISPQSIKEEAKNIKTLDQLIKEGGMTLEVNTKHKDKSIRKKLF